MVYKSDIKYISHNNIIISYIILCIFICNLYFIMLKKNFLEIFNFYKLNNIYKTNYKIL